MKTFNAPSVEVLKFAMVDVITVSGDTEEDTLPEIRD